MIDPAIAKNELIRDNTRIDLMSPKFDLRGVNRLSFALPPLVFR
jgi:hypothetical protein